MSRSRIFSLFSFSNADILIPQEQIVDSVFITELSENGTGNSSMEKSLPVINLDQVYGEKKRHRVIALAKVPECECRQIYITASSIPQIKEIKLETIKPVMDLAKKKLAHKGIIGLRFEENRIQYLINLGSIVK